MINYLYSFGHHEKSRHGRSKKIFWKGGVTISNTLNAYSKHQHTNTLLILINVFALWCDPILLKWASLSPYCGCWICNQFTSPLCKQKTAMDLTQMLLRRMTFSRQERNKSSFSSPSHWFSARQTTKLLWSPGGSCKGRGRENWRKEWVWNKVSNLSSRCRWLLAKLKLPDFIKREFR